MKEDLMFCCLGNGISVADRNREEHNDYMMVAHIGYNRKITYYDKKLSQDAIHSIEYYAKYENSSASVTQSYPVLKPVLFSKMDVTELKKLFETKLTNRVENLKIEVAAYS